ncbi:TPR repeat-containing protein (plasmid) [Nostoc sp. HK-01]|nr:TPR repeat-containing protein [Nostoc sp. HK-01]
MLCNFRYFRFVILTLLLSLSSSFQVALTLVNMKRVWAEVPKQTQSIDEARQLNQQVRFRTSRMIAQSKSRFGQVEAGLKIIDLARQQYEQGKYQESLKSLQQALMIVKEIGEDTEEGQLLKSLTLLAFGSVYQMLGEYSLALDSFQQALHLFQQNNDKKHQASTLVVIGLIYYLKSQYPQALSFYQQALAIQQEMGDKKGQAISFNHIGLIYLDQGYYNQALKHLKKSLTLRNDATTLGNIGRTYYKLGQYPKALEYNQQALNLVRETHNKDEEAYIINNIADVYEKLGQYFKALELYQQALAIANQFNNQEELSIIFNNIAILYNNLGQYAKAIEYYQKALEITQKTEDKSGTGSIFTGLGSVYEDLGQYSKALNFYQKSLSIDKEIGDKAGVGVSLSNIASVYIDLKDYSEAIKALEQSLAIAQEIGDINGEKTRLGKLGQIYEQQNDRLKALDYYLRELAIAKKIGDKPGEGAALQKIGSLFFLPMIITADPTVSESEILNVLQKNYVIGLDTLNKAAAIFHETGDKSAEGEALGVIGVGYYKWKQYANAEQYLWKTIKLFESLRPGLRDEENISLFDKQSITYVALQQSLIAQNKIDVALEVAERGRARALVELLAARINQNSPNQIRINFPQVAEMQQIAKLQNATLVQYTTLDTSIVNKGEQERQRLINIWVVKPTGEIVFQSQPFQTPLEKLVSTSREAIGINTRSIFDVQPTVPHANQTEQLKQLHQLLIKPIAQYLPTNPDDKVIFIPYNELFLVPFAALQDEQGKYLIEKHTILTAPAIQVLQLTHEQRQKVSGTGALVVGNPVMPTLAPNIGEKPQKLKPLKNAEQEAIEIARILNTKPLTGKQATKATVKELMTKAKIIHLATHGLLNDFGFGIPGAIALAPNSTVKLGQQDSNGFLTAGEIFDMKLNAELVVLSACETGQGNITGDGVIGLSRSLIAAGVPSVVVSLWNIDDKSTKLLMTEFYRQMQQTSDKAQALRQAMLITMKQYPQPKYWAAFTLIGESL